MKRIVSLLLSLVVLCSVIPGAMAAEEEGKLSLTGRVSTVERGSVMAVSLELNRNPGIASLRLTLSFDRRVMEPESIVDQGLFSQYTKTEDEGELILRWSAEQGGESSVTGTLAHISFRIREDAPYGEGTVTVKYYRNLFDIQDKNGRPVDFQVVPLTFTLPCPHENTEEKVTKEATFEKAGILEERCKDCGAVEEKPLFATLSSADGKITATPAPGALPEKGEKTVEVEFFYGGEDYEAAKGYFPDALFRVFRVRFTLDGVPFEPLEETELSLITDFDLPEKFALYSLGEEGLDKENATFRQTSLEFTYEPSLYIIVAREDVQAPEMPSEGDVIPTAPATSSAGEGGAEENGEVWTFVLFAVMFVVFGAGIVFLLKQKKTF